jgi:hypothetical protein
VFGCLQALSEGDLSQRARDRATAVAVDIDFRLRAPHKFWRDLAAEPSGLPAAGTEIRLSRPSLAQFWKKIRRSVARLGAGSPLVYR